MKILFADYVDPETHTRKEIDPKAQVMAKRKWWDVLIEQCINAAIVGGIAGLSATDPDVAWKAFAITFLIEMRKYRKL